MVVCGTSVIDNLIQPCPNWLSSDLGFKVSLRKGFPGVVALVSLPCTRPYKVLSLKTYCTLWGTNLHDEITERYKIICQPLLGN